MPVLFLCQHCHQPMRASRRKAGTLADCPHCRQPNMVPAVAMGDPTDASTALAQAEGRFVPQGGGFDDIADLIGAPSAPTAGARPPSGGMPAFEPASQRVQARTSIRSNVTEDALLVITRRGVYAHGTLLLFVALAFLAAGYWIGHGTLPEIPAANDTTSMPSESAIKFEGNLSYLAAPGEIKPDAEAVVIVLPFDARPEHKLASRGLRPTDTSATEKAAAAASLRALGGACGRAGAEGDFHLNVPRPGKFYLLAISKNAKREAGRSIEFDDLRAMGHYFEHAAEVIGTCRYHWSPQEIDNATPRFKHEFPAATDPSTRSTSSGRQFP